MSTAAPARATYAVGDLHGRLDLLTAALDAIAGHSEGAEARLVFLGDYVDRGPDSRGVVERLMALQGDPRVVCLKGNHEDMMVRALREGLSADVRVWLRNGGGETLQSYGAAEIDEAAGKVPDAHLRWMSRLPLTSGDPHRIYVHAGLAPRRALDQQDEATCLWIREQFLQADAADFERHVVHGHTPVWRGKPDMSAAELLPHRTNLDTGAYHTGVLSIGVFRSNAHGGPEEIISIHAEPGAAPSARTWPARSLEPPLVKQTGASRSRWSRLLGR